MVKPINLLFIFALVFLSPSKASDNTHHTLSKNDYTLIGEGTMKVLFFDLYHARLYGNTADKSTHSLFEINYLKDIPAKKLISATREQWEHIGLSNTAIPQWLSEIEQIWPDINKGDTLILRRNENGQAEFYHQNNYIGTVADPRFTDAFLAIWLSEKTSEPTLRKKLLGHYE
jgi:hypothetical protein